MSNDEFDEKIKTIRDIVDGEIKDGNREESDREPRIERIIKKYDEKFPGFLDYYTKVKGKKKKKKSNAKPKAQAKPKPASRELPDMAQEWIKTWANSQEEDEGTIEKKFWVEFDKNDHLEDDQRVEMSLMTLLNQFSSTFTRQAIGYTFTPIDVVPHYTYQGKEWQEIPGSDKKKEVATTRHSGRIYGIFRDNKHDVESFGSVAAWEEDTAHCIDDLEPFTTYNGNFEGKLDNGLYKLNLNSVQEFEEQDDSISKEDLYKLCAEYITTSQEEIWKVSDFADEEAFPIGGKEILIKGLVSRKNPIKIKNGENTGGISLSPSELGLPHEVFLYFWQDAEKMSEVEPGDIVYARSFTKRDKEGLRHSVKWVIPIGRLELPTAEPPKPEA